MPADVAHVKLMDAQHPKAQTASNRMDVLLDSENSNQRTGKVGSPTNSDQPSPPRNPLQNEDDNLMKLSVSIRASSAASGGW